MVPDVRKPFTVHCGKCRWEWAIAFLPLDAEAFGKLKFARCPACNSKDVLCGDQPKPTDSGNAIAWVSNGDTGTSSLTIWSVLMNQIVRDTSHNWPCDPDDFGRCHRLLKVMPEWRARLGEVAARFPGTPWVALIERWDEVAALYEQELAEYHAQRALPKRRRTQIEHRCYALMKALGC